MKRVRNPEAKRRKIIDATHKVLREGRYFMNFSIDKVAEVSGVSKGGILHHFPTRDALLRAAAKDVADQFTNTLDAKIESQEQQGNGQMTNAYVDLLLDDSLAEPVFELSPLLLSYINDTEITGEPNQFEYWQTRTEEDGIDVITATIVRLAADGLIYSELIDNKPIPSELKQQIHNRLRQMLKQNHDD